MKYDSLEQPSSQKVLPTIATGGLSNPIVEQDVMTEKLIEKIAQLHGEDKWKDDFYGDYVTEKDREACRIWAKQILALVKEAGYVKLAEIKSDTRPPMYL